MARSKSFGMTREDVAVCVRSVIVNAVTEDVLAFKREMQEEIDRLKREIEMLDVHSGDAYVQAKG